MPRPGEPQPDLPTLLRRLALPALFVAAVAYTQLSHQPVSPPPAVDGPPTTELSGAVMGTDFMVKIRGETLDTDQQQAAAEAVRQALDAVDAAMSTWKSTSELSLFNQRQDTAPMGFSPPTLAVFEVARQVHQASGGAFDITVGPLVDRWGFGAGRTDAPPPEPGEIAGLLERVGQDKLLIDRAAGTVAKSHPGLSADLSAVAKGYAVDQVALALEALGHLHYLVEVGGEVRAGAVPEGALPWRLGVERPEPGRRTVFEVVELDALSMATSGDYRNFTVEEGKRRSHTIDPRTGSPVSHELASVTVLHPQCASADAWATALMVLGPEAGLALAEQQGLAAMFLSRSDSGLERIATAAFSTHQEGLSEAMLGDTLSMERAP